MSFTMARSFRRTSRFPPIYQAGFPNAELKWYDRVGNEVGTAGRPSALWGQVRISRDGKRVAATVWSPENGGTGIWIFDANSRESRRLTFPPEVHRRPVWSPDGTQLAVGGSPAVGRPQLAIVDVTNGKGQPFVDVAGTMRGGARGGRQCPIPAIRFAHRLVAGWPVHRSRQRPRG